MALQASTTSSSFLDDQLSDWIVVPKMASQNGNNNNKISGSPPQPPSRPQSHQSGVILNHWNDLPQSFIPSNSSSRGSSRAGTPNIVTKNTVLTTSQPNRYPSP